ncbi:MAG: biofilm-associated protein [Nitrosopumilaceae archaeon]|nr:biofilm-associated protein [Nitrosopumilaceae archaeon]
MSKSSMRGIFLSIILIVAVSFSLIPNVLADDSIIVESTSFEKSTIVNVLNNGNTEVYSFRIWLGSDFEFESFKTESGWLGEMTPQGVIIFTSTNPLMPNENVKFGIKTDNPKPGINWKALDNRDTQIEIGKSIPGVQKNNLSTSSRTNTGGGINSDSFFRIIPDKPNVGGDIRVTGENFGPSQEFEFFIDSKKLGTFQTDDKGYFMNTFQIPENQKAERVEFIVKDDGLEKKVSLRLGDGGTLIPSSEIVKLTIKGIPEVMHRGDFLEISGTAQPGSAVTASIKDPENKVINTRTAEVDAKGMWKLDEPIIVPLDTPFGKYTAEINDGRESIVKAWTVETDKKIIIAPTNLKFNPGETMRYNGTAIPNLPIELVLKDPLGIEKISDIFQVGKDGIVGFEYSTTANVDKEGTWTLIATQGKNKEFIYAGLGELPSIPVNIEFDKLNYKSSENAKISLTGKPSEVLNLLIIDPSDKPKGNAVQITIKPDGTQTYELDLDGYSSGVYSAVVSKGSAKSTATFTVGLLTGSGDINIGTTKTSYEPGESILILGQTKPNVLLTITLTDPNGNQIKSEEAYSDKSGKITENSFRIPSEATPGKWILNGKSGSNFYNHEIEVTTLKVEGLVIFVEDANQIPGVGKIVTIRVLGAEQLVVIEVLSDEGEIIEELRFPASDEGKVIQPWIIPPDIEPGEYTFTAKDAFNSAKTTYQLK